MELSLPGGKLPKERLKTPLSAPGVCQNSVSAHRELNATALAVVPATLFYHHLQGRLKSTLASGSHGYDSAVTLSLEAQEELT